jgi:ubiquinone/menaquinone biosynthesis C-methylase UbiE
VSAQTPPLPEAERRPRVDYDAIAHLYDAQPHRARAADPQLDKVASGRDASHLAVLDIGCGTGNQLIANREAWPPIRFVGLDRSFGMLRQARKKAADITWVAADAAALPFAATSFDFVCCQFAFHHIDDKPGMLREALRALRPGGGFVLHNLCPQQSGDWLYYEYFPEARRVDLRDFWAPDTIAAAMKAAGFAAIDTAYRHIAFEEDLAAWLDIVRRRDSCSQLHAISDAAYRAGVARLEHDIVEPSIPPSRHNHLCLVTIRGEAPAAG